MDSGSQDKTKLGLQKLFYKHHLESMQCRSTRSEAEGWTRLRRAVVRKCEDAQGHRPALGHVAAQDVAEKKAWPSVAKEAC